MGVGVIVALAVLVCAAAVGVATSDKCRPRRVAGPVGPITMREKYAGLAFDCIQQAKQDYARFFGSFPTGWRGDREIKILVWNHADVKDRAKDWTKNGHPMTDEDWRQEYRFCVMNLEFNQDFLHGFSEALGPFMSDLIKFKAVITLDLNFDARPPTPRRAQAISAGEDDASSAGVMAARLESDPSLRAEMLRLGVSVSISSHDRTGLDDHPPTLDETSQSPGRCVS